MRTTISSLAFVGLLLLPAAALAGEEDDAGREDDMFGEGSDAGPSTEQKLAEKLVVTDDPLTIGGELYTRFQYNIMDEGNLDDFGLQSPNLLHLYLDARPNDRVRAFARGRLFFDYTIEEGDTDMFGQEREPLDVFLDQLWLKFDIARSVYVTIGRQAARWGSGRFWNPTDFLNAQRRDPLAIFDERLGVSLLKVHIPIESLGWNLYAVANLDGASTLDEVGAAFRAEFLFGKTELAASAAVRKDQPLRLGLDVSTAIWDFDVRVEGALTHNDETTFWRGRLDPVNMLLPEPYSREDDWIPQITAGAEISILYSDQDSVIIGLEYFYNDAGTTDANLYPWLAFNGQLTPFYLGQQYASLYVLLMNPGDWNDTTFVLSGIANLTDGTGIVRFDYQVLLLTYLQLSAFVSVYTGDKGEFHFAFEVPPVDGVPGLEDGLSIPGQRLQLGLWLRLKV